MQLIGHRGARGEAPENTLGGFKYIRDLGLKAVEFDVRLTQDHQLAIIHDDNFLRTAALDQHVALTHSDQLILTNNCVGWPQWTNAEPTPLLTNLLPIIESFTHIEVEVKSVDDIQQARQIVTQLHQALAGWQNRVTITSFDLNVLQALQDEKSSFKRGLLVQLPLGDAIIELALQLGCQRVGLKDSLTTPELIEQIKQAQLQCSVWTVNDVERARQLATWQVDGLITDIPAHMLQAQITGLRI